MLAYDAAPPTADHANGFFFSQFTHVRSGDGVGLFSDTDEAERTTPLSQRALLIVWPNNPEAAGEVGQPPVWDTDCLTAYLDAGGHTVIYVGEREASIREKLMPGATADSGVSSSLDFQELLIERCELVERVVIPTWRPWHSDDLTVWRAKGVAMPEGAAATVAAREAAKAAEWTASVTGGEAAAKAKSATSKSKSAKAKKAKQQAKAAAKAAEAEAAAEAAEVTAEEPEPVEQPAVLQPPVQPPPAHTRPAEPSGKPSATSAPTSGPVPSPAPAADARARDGRPEGGVRLGAEAGGALSITRTARKQPDGQLAASVGRARERCDARPARDPH